MFEFLKVILYFLLSKIFCYINVVFYKYLEEDFFLLTDQGRVIFFYEDDYLAG